MGNTKIEWTNKTWNPVRGCSVVSEGCRNCYAMNFAARFAGEGMPYEGLAYRNGSGAHWTGKVQLIEEHLRDPISWRKPQMVFVNSMSDLFHESIPDKWIDRIFGVMGDCDELREHVFQVLTKRPARMLEYMITRARKAWNAPRMNRSAFPPRNVWLGVSVEDQKTADERIPLLLQTPAAVRWISAEPLLGPVNLSAYMGVTPNITGEREQRYSEIDWAVVGGESGPRARPMDLQWVRSLREQCVAAGVPFFFKQWGQWIGGEGDGRSPAIWQDGNTGIHPFAERDSCQYFKFGPLGEPGTFSLSIGKKAAGRLLDGREWNEFPQAGAPA